MLSRKAHQHSDSIPIRGIHAQELLDEEIPLPAQTIRTAVADTMVGARHEDEIEVLVGGDQRIDDLHRARRVNVIVELGDDEHQRAGESVGVHDVRGRVVHVVVDGPPHPRLVPPLLVQPVVVAAAVGDGGLVEVAVPQQRGQRALPARGAADDADARQVHPRPGGRRGAEPRNAVQEPSVPQVLVAVVMECLGPPVRPHPVDLYHHKAQFRELVLARQWRE